jgi:hypothetical protein
LETLNLQQNDITDAGLENLYGLKNLKQIQLGQTKVTKEGVEKLQAALPKAKITSDVN